jgi:hypothetical protein
MNTKVRKIYLITVNGRKLSVDYPPTETNLHELFHLCWGWSVEESKLQHVAVEQISLYTGDNTRPALSSVLKEKNILMG